MSSDKNTNRIAGILWLLSIVAGGFGLSYIRSSVIVPADATATAANIHGSEFMFRLAIVGLLLGQVLFFFLGLTLFHSFKAVNRRLATVLLAAAILIVGVAVGNTLNHFAALLILSRPEFLNVFTHEQLDALALLFLRQGNNAGQGLIEIFWTPFYFTLGLLVIKSGYLPKLLGIFLMIMGAGFTINILDKFLVPQFHPVLFTRMAMSFGALGGVPTVLWLLIKGIRAQPEINHGPA